MKTLMILGASILQLPAIRKARSMGIRVIGVDMDPYAVGMTECDVALPISTIDIPAVVAAAKEYRIDGVMTLASDMPMRTVARVGWKLGLPAISESAAFRATDKFAMREALFSAGVPVPLFFAVRTYVEYQQVVAQLGAPCWIIKPADSSGSRGVHLVSSTLSVDAQERLFADSLSYSRSGKVMVEEFMTGPEISVESLTIHGETQILAITDKLIVGNGNFTEIGHTQPSALPQEVQNAVCTVVKKTVQAIGIDYSPSHTELKITPDGPKVVEIGARMGGDNITTHLVPLSTGIDMVAACIDIALGQPVKPYILKPNNAAIRYFQPPAGVIRSICGVDEARKLPGVKEVVLLRKVGESVPQITSSTDRIGFVIAQGTETENAATICERAMNMIQIEVETK